MTSSKNTTNLVCIVGTAHKIEQNCQWVRSRVWNPSLSCTWWEKVQSIKQVIEKVKLTYQVIEDHAMQHECYSYQVRQSRNRWREMKDR